MNNKDIKIGIALSGGGIRAAVFHLGVLRYLAENCYLDKVTYLSSVSGGSLLIGLIYKFSGWNWPSNDKYIQEVHPALKELLTSDCLQRKICIKFWLSFLCPWSWWLIVNRTNLLAKILSSNWEITKTLQDITNVPLWAINATTSETGKSWRFSKKKMGDYKVGYVFNPKFRIADAMAISAAYPVGLGKYRFDAKKFEWKKYDSFSKDKTSPLSLKYGKYHLWDGGIYDNLGSEPLFEHFGTKLREEVNYVLFCDAGAPLEELQSHWEIKKNLLRISDILSEQIRSLRARMIFHFLKGNPGKGVYIQIGKSFEGLLNSCEDFSKVKDMGPFLSSNETTRAASYETDLKKITVTDFDLIEHHGYESAKIKICTYPFKITQ